jgi:hypothetical protein
MLSTLRRKILGETRSIPLGLVGAFVLALAVRALLPPGEWEVVGGFALAAAVIATLICSLPHHQSRRSTDRRSAAVIDNHTNTRTDR